LNRNPGAKKAIFDELPPRALKTFNDLGKVTTGIFKAKKFENVSGTGRAIIAAFNNGNIFQKIIGTKTGKFALEVPGAAIGLPPGTSTALGFGSDLLARSKGPKTKAIDDFLTSPAFKQSLENAALGNEVVAEAITKTRVFKNWLTAQPPAIKGEIAAIGFIPWVTGELDFVNVDVSTEELRRRTQ